MPTPISNARVRANESHCEAPFCSKNVSQKEFQIHFSSHSKNETQFRVKRKIVQANFELFDFLILCTTGRFDRFLSKRILAAFWVCAIVARCNAFRGATCGNNEYTNRFVAVNSFRRIKVTQIAPL